MTKIIPHDQLPLNSLGLPETVWFTPAGELYFLDQTQLPLNVVGERQDTLDQVFVSIKALKVRGAPAIGVAGAYGLLVGIRDQLDRSKTEFRNLIASQAERLGEARPTAVNLKWALNRMQAFAATLPNRDNEDLFRNLTEEAIRIHNEDRQLCRQIGIHGVSLIKPRCGVLTHCNAGSLATAEFGTATAPMYLAHQNKVPFTVYADETRPLLQGARLTSWELQHAGIDVRLITDNMSAHLMASGLIDLVIVGTDRVAANGDVANKIGTLGVAIIAKHFGIPFYVACPYSTIDFQMESGDQIPIEERDTEEVTSFGARRTGPAGIRVRNPAFDVTPADLVTGIITERGLVRQPLNSGLRELYA